VFSKEELLERTATLAKTTGQAPLVQEFIEGDEYGVEMVAHMGVPLATFVHKRVRSLSPRGGAAVVKETAQKNQQTEDMVGYAKLLIEKLAWTGPLMVEFKINKKNDEVLLMEINGRFWGSLPLAVQAGVDFPLIAYKLARGENTGNIQEAFSAPYVRTRHFLGDLLWVWRVFFARDNMRPYLYPSRLRALWDFKTEIFRSKGDVFSLRDLKPSFVEYLGILSK
jgi:predicted ATP-grasp superfamily ATP-dependent carboligase